MICRSSTDATKICPHPLHLSLPPAEGNCWHLLSAKKVSRASVSKEQDGENYRKGMGATGGPSVSEDAHGWPFYLPAGKASAKPQHSRREQLGMLQTGLLLQ